MFNNNENINLEAYVNGFPFMSNDELVNFARNNQLSFSLEQLIFIRDYFKNEKKAFPTYNQIMFFDAINKVRKSQKKDYSIYSASATDGAHDIIESSKDMLTKKGAIKKKIYGAMPLSFASEIASEYLKQLGLSENSKHFLPANKAPFSEYYIHTDDDIPLFTYSNPNNSQQKNTVFQTPPNATNSHNTLVMIYPTEGMGYNEYNARTDGFLSLPEIAPMISDSTTINSPYGIFNVLMKERNGIFVNLSEIPEIEKDEYGKVRYLTSLITSCENRKIFSTNYTCVGLLNHIAQHYSLKICIFATRNFSQILSFESIKNPAFNFDFNFLQKLISFSEHHEYIFTDEQNLPLGARKNVYLTDRRTPIRQTHRAERILNFGNVMASACARELDTTPHSSAALTVIDAANTLIAKGVSKDSITLYIHYSLLCGTDDSKELGKNLASVLGAYRSMIELCISDTEPQISYTEKSKTIVVLASAKPPKRQIKSVFPMKTLICIFIKYPIAKVDSQIIKNIVNSLNIFIP